NDWTPIWSPDDQKIAFFSNRGGSQAIWISPRMGGTLQFVQTVPGVSAQLRRWSSDGNTIYYEADHNFYAVDLNSHDVTQLTGFDPATSDSRDFAISPQEDKVAYSDSQNGQFDIWTMPLRGGQRRRVTNDSKDDIYPVWDAQGERIIYSSIRNGV